MIAHFLRTFYARSIGALVLVSCTLLATGNADAQQPLRTKMPDFNELAGSIKMQTGAQLVKAENGVPQIILGSKGSALIAAEPKYMTPAMIAERSRDFFITTGASLGFLASSAEIKANDAVQVGQAYNTLLTVSYNGIPVRGRKAQIAIGAQSGELLAIRNSLPAVEPSVTTAKISAQSVLDKIAPAMTASSKVTLEPTLVYLPSRDNRTLRLAYEVRVSEPQNYWRYTFDALTGSLIEKKDLVVYCSDPAHDHASEAADPFMDTPPMAPAATVGGKVQGRVLYYSPFKPDTTVAFPFIKVIVNGKTVYADPEGNFSVPDVSYPLTISSTLESRFFKVNRADDVDAKLTSTVTSGLANIDWLSTTGTLAERSAYTSAHRVYQHVKSFDPNFTAIDQKIVVNVNVSGGSCNAYYRPDDQTLNFYPKSGTCSNTAEIADVVYHEYGHHYQHIRYREAGTEVVSGALGEGFADVISNLMRDNSIIGDGFTGSGSVLRNSDNTKKWPTNVSSDPHLTGEILTGAVWDLRRSIGLERSRYLYHESLKAAPDASFEGEGAEQALEAFTDVLMAYLLADDEGDGIANGTPNSDAIVSAFEKHGIGLSNLISLNVNSIADQDTIAVDYPVDLTAKYTGVLGSINQDSVKLYYSVNNGPFVTLNASHQSGDQFVTSIPKLPSGSIVKYYSTARTTLVQSGTVRTPRTGTYTFLVGYQKRYSDNGETELNHDYGISTDNAPMGLWERAIPAGTIWIDQFFQLDSDHTAGGRFAYVTGNANASTGSTDPLEDALFDFSSQSTLKTTLQTSSFDLSKVKSPMLKFWYYQRSEQVFAAGINYFKVTVSTNDGSSWREAYKSAEVFDGWTSVIVPITLGATANDKVKLRFLAQAAPGTIVEAGVDDIEILESMAPSNPGGTGDVADGEALKLDIATYPNPVSHGKFTFKYTLPQTAVVQAELKNVMGRTVWSTNGELKPMGPHSENVSLDLPNGTYWLQLSTSMGTAYKQVHVVK
jgi:Zn-dependent metalloprotease